MPKILLVDDDIALTLMVKQGLSFDHYQVETTCDGADALEMLRTNSFDAAIVDLNLPSLSGCEICKRYRAEGGKIPILMLTARTEVVDKVSGLSAGADDYLTKPFALEELRARVQALLRRVDKQYNEQGLVRVGKVVLDATTFKVTSGGQPVQLVRKEFAILELLARHAGRVFSADEIISRAWISDECPSSDVVRSHIRNIRKKFGDDDIIRSVYGLGYKMDPDA